MKDVRITVMTRAIHTDLMEKYENPLEHACSFLIGQVFVSHDSECPEGFCSEAWKSMCDYVRVLAEGGGNFFDGWMKNEKSAMISCSDGFRPVSFYLETVED